MKKIICLLAFISISTFSIGQNNNATNKLQVFLDCSNSWCDMTYIRTEINIIDFQRDRLASDVHVLVTSQNTGSGGQKYQMIYYGQNRFQNVTDTISFNIEPNTTEVELREIYLKYFKLGLTPFIAKTGLVKDLKIDMKSTGNNETVKTETTKDPWNYWVYRIGVNGNLNADRNYKSSRYNGNFSLNRTTEDLKVELSVNAGKNKSIFEIDNGTSIDKFEVDNHNLAISHYLVKSINDHWSYGYELNYSNSTFSNNKSRVYFRAAAEYNIFKYKEVNNKFFTISYGIDSRRNKYFDTTVYNKTQETLLGHSLQANITLNKKWGSFNSGINYSNYFHNWQFNNLSINLNLNVRITGGLSVYMYSFGGLIHDQVYLPKGGATEQEILTRRRQLESAYNFFTGFGINYRFGSKINNFVNPRFNSSNNDFFIN